MSKSQSVEARLIAMENVLQETRLTMEAALFALAAVLRNTPDISEDLRTAAALTAECEVSDTDVADRERTVASRAHAAAILNTMADTVDANAEKRSRLILDTGAGLQ